MDCVREMKNKSSNDTVRRIHFLFFYCVYFCVHCGVRLRYSVYDSTVLCVKKGKSPRLNKALSHFGRGEAPRSNVQCVHVHTVWRSSTVRSHTVGLASRLNTS